MGYVFVLAYFLAALYMRNEEMKRVSIVAFVILGVLAIPTYISGAATMWALAGDPDYPRSLINHHRDMGLLAFIGLGLTGCFAYVVLWRQRQGAGLPNTSIYVLLGMAAVTLFLMAEAGHEGGFINHMEIRADAPDLVINDENVGTTVNIENAFNNVSWSFPAMETFHFLGMSMVFGTVLFVTLRILGFVKSIPFSGVHRLLPIGLAGLFINSFSGMLLFISDSGRYVAMPGFPPKIIAVVIGAIAVIYFSLSDRLWAVKAGDDAPAFAKLVALVVLVSWTAVVILGRWLPYSEY
jgi:hypothetical protein